jgi:hypothetical protein
MSAAPVDTPRVIHIEDLIDSRAVTADGRRLGHIVDVLVSADGQYRVLALELGRYGWLDRLDMLRPLARYLGGRPQPRIVPWEDVRSFERFTVCVEPRDV